MPKRKKHTVRITMKHLASYVAKKEGKLHQSSIGDVREILAILSDLAFRHPVEFTLALHHNGRRRFYRGVTARR